MLIFSQKDADITKIKYVLVPKGIFSDNIYVFVVKYQISSFQHNPKEF